MLLNSTQPGAAAHTSRTRHRSHGGQVRGWAVTRARAGVFSTRVRLASRRWRAREFSALDPSGANVAPRHRRPPRQRRLHAHYQQRCWSRPRPAPRLRRCNRPSYQAEDGVIALQLTPPCLGPLPPPRGRIARRRGRRVVCHTVSCLAKRGGLLHSPNDAQAGRG